MTLYIPTTSLNFNNILSTESISPKAFYSQRGFGYSRWFSIPENEMDGAILLYESPFEICRPKSDVEDHPLLIEIETEEEFPILIPGVRYSQHTIYFNPWNTNFYFQTEKDKTIALSMSDSSLETKLIRLYFNKISVKPFIGNYPNVEKLPDIPVDKSAIADDILINKIKGLLYGYYIGANLSSSTDDIEKLNTLREIQDIFAATISTQERIPNNVQMSRLSELFSFLAQYEPLYNELLHELGSTQTVNRVITLLRRYGHEILQFNWKSIVNELQYDTNGHNSALSWIQRELDQHHKLMLIKRELLSVDDEQIISDGKHIIKLSNKILPIKSENSLYLYWINNVLIQSKYSGKISSIKAELADDLTQAAISCMGDCWKDSEIRTYLNQLRKHVRGEEFTQPWTNGLLSSVSAVITKGDDWEQLLCFLQKKQLTDYRLAFSFYGILNGYANLTRDFTDLLYNSDSKYVAKVYKEFYGQLLGKEIIKSKVPESESRGFSEILYVDSETAVKENTLIQGEFQDFFKLLVEKCKGASKDESYYRDLYFAHNGINSAFFNDVMADKRLNKGKGVQQTVQKFIQKKLREATQTFKHITNNKPSHNLFENSYSSTGIFLQDYDFLINSSDFQDVVGRHSDWERDLKWFIDAHNPNNKYFSYYRGKPMDNLTIIKQFIFLHMKEFPKGKYINAKDYLCRLYNVDF